MILLPLDGHWKTTIVRHLQKCWKERSCAQRTVYTLFLHCSRMKFLSHGIVNAERVNVLESLLVCTVKKDEACDVAMHIKLATFCGPLMQCAFCIFVKKCLCNTKKYIHIFQSQWNELRKKFRNIFSAICFFFQIESFIFRMYIIWCINLSARLMPTPSGFK